MQVAALQSAAAEQAAFAAADLARHGAASEAALASARIDAAAAAAQAQQDSKAAAACAALEAAVRDEGLRDQVRDAVARAAGEAVAREAVQLQLDDALAATRGHAAEVFARLQAAAAASDSAAEESEEPARLDAAEAEVERLNALLQDSTAEVAALRAVVLAQCQERKGWHGAQGQGRPVQNAQGSPEQKGVQELGCGASTRDGCKHGLGGKQSTVGDPGAGARWASARPARAVRQRLGRHFVA